MSQKRYFVGYVDRADVLVGELLILERVRRSTDGVEVGDVGVHPVHLRREGWESFRVTRRGVSNQYQIFPAICGEVVLRRSLWENNCHLCLIDDSPRQQCHNRYTDHILPGLRVITN